MGEYVPLYVFLGMLVLFGAILPFMVSDFVDLEEDRPETSLLGWAYDFVGVSSLDSQIISGYEWTGSTNDRGEEYGYVRYQRNGNNDFSINIKTRQLIWFNNAKIFLYDQQGNEIESRTLTDSIANRLNPLDTSLTSPFSNIAEDIEFVELRLERTQDNIQQVFTRSSGREITDYTEISELQPFERDVDDGFFSSGIFGFSWSQGFNFLNPFYYMPQGFIEYIQTAIIGFTLIPTFIQIPVIIITMLSFIYTILKLVPFT